MPDNLIIFIPFLILLINSYSSLELPECPSGPGPTYIPDSTDCTQFYLCVFGEGTLIQCPNGQHFSPEFEDCGPPEESSCKITTTVSPDSSSSDSTTVKITESPGLCPPSGSSFVPHPSDCTKFYICMGGDATLMDCPEGEHFSAAELKCLPESEAGCISLTTSKQTTPEITTSTPEFTTIILSTTPSAATMPQITEPTEICPSSGSSFVPHPNDCTKFYLCMAGAATLLDCPPGEHFSPSQFKCLPPNEAGCMSLTTTESTVLPTPESTTVILTSSPEITTSQATERPELCPPSGSEFVPHPSDCTKFYLCMGGDATLMDCPPGQHFSPTELKCLPPSEAGCMLLTTNEQTSPETTISTSKLTTIIVTTKPSEATTPQITNPPSICPPSGSEFVPHPSDCTKFYLCMGGDATLMDCPPGQHFSPTELNCLAPEEAGCESVTTNKPTTITPTSPITETSTGETTTSIPTTVLPTTTEVTDAPIICPPSGTSLIPHPDDCTKFYMCILGELKLMSCPEGQHFSPTELKCLTPDDANCMKTTTELTTVEVTLDPSLCPSTGSAVVAHPEDCTKFYVCMSGVPIELSCPPGKHFSLIEMDCLPPDEAGCSFTTLFVRHDVTKTP